MSAEKRPITIEDLAQIRYVDEPQLSPDGRWIAYVLTTPDLKEDSYTRNIWLVSVAGGDPIQLTRGNKDSSPRWSPDGQQLVFVSARNKKPQIFLLSVTAPGGEARPLTNAENGATAPAWSPDGAFIAYLSPMNAAERAQEDSAPPQDPPADKLESKYREERKAEDEKRRWDPRPVWRIPYRADPDFLDDRYAQIYIIPTAANGDAKPRRMTNTDADYEPPQWTPDGRALYSARTVDPTADTPWRWQNIVKIDVETAAETRLEDHDYSVFNPRLSPDGRWLACTRMPRDKTDRVYRFTLMSLDGDETRDLNATLDRNIGNYVWSPDGHLLYTVLSEGYIEPYSYDPAQDAHQKLAHGAMNITGLDVGAGGALALAITTPDNPSEIYTWSTDGGLARRTNINQAFLDQVIVQPHIELRWQAQNGMSVQGWYLLPVGYEEGHTYPLSLNIHGGPHIMWGPCERTMWHEFQAHAARGYVVFYCNPRGADGYGDAFMSALHANWGPVAEADILAGLDALLARGFVDEGRLAVTGGSYGGYMTAWLISHHDRFKAAVAQRGVYNLYSFYGTSDVPLLISSEYDVHPWENPTLLWEHSPIAHAHRIRTPLLIIHAENDYRVPIEQSEQLFAIVRRATQTPVRMLRYPREGHEMSRSGEPRHRIHHLNAMLDWFDTYCRQQEG